MAVEVSLTTNGTTNVKKSTIMSSSNLSYIFNLANSIIGVGVLAMPYCFSQCGILLSIVLLCCCNLITRITCYLLMKSSQITRKISFESLAFHTFGPMGKLLVEFSIIGFLIGCLIAFFVVMGDLGPEVISHLTGVEKTSNIRTSILMILGLFVILPFSLLRKLDSLTIFSVLSIVFYMIFIVKILLQSLPNLWAGEWMNHVRYWNINGALTCLPIFAMALSCQTQFFEIYNVVPEPSVKKMSSIVTGSVNICTVIYITVGILGYITFYDVEIKGNLLTMFPTSLVTEAVRLGFVLTVALSFPLVIFPCRASIHSLMCGKTTGSVMDTMSRAIPDRQFKIITFSIVFGTWMIGVLVPNIELVLGLNGSTVGTIICIILPTTMFIQVVTKNTNEKLMAQVVFGIGVFVLVASTYATLNNADKSEIANLEDQARKFHLKSADEVVGITNNSKKEPPVPVEPDTVDKLKPNIVKRDESPPNVKQPQKEDLINKVVKQQEQILKQQKEIIDDIKQHHAADEIDKKEIEIEIDKKVEIVDELLKKQPSDQNLVAPPKPDPKEHIKNTQQKKSDRRDSADRHIPQQVNDNLSKYNLPAPKIPEQEIPAKYVPVKNSTYNKAASSLRKKNSVLSNRAKSDKDTLNPKEKSVKNRELLQKHQLRNVKEAERTNDGNVEPQRKELNPTNENNEHGQDAPNNEGPKNEIKKLHGINDNSQTM